MLFLYGKEYLVVSVDIDCALIFVSSSILFYVIRFN